MNKLHLEKSYIDSFNEPTDDIDRVYFHFSCLEYWKKKKNNRWKDLLAYLFVAFLLPLYFFNGLFTKKRETVRAVFIISSSRESGTYDYTGVFPIELEKEFPDLKKLVFNRYPSLFSGVLSRDALKLWLQLVRRYPLEGYMNWLCFSHIMSAERLRKMYSPKAVVNFRMEFNWASSLITKYYEDNGISHINFMHGDYLADIRRAFVRFTKCYVFDKHYIDVFLWSRSPKGQFVVYKPTIHNGIIPKNEHPQYYLSYYFSGEEGNIYELVEVLVNLVKIGHVCKVRPHPRYSNKELISKAFESTGIIIEDCTVPIEQSIADSQYVAGRKSTVLTQAYYAGKTIVIDDISMPETYDNMRESMDIMYYREHIRLSKFMNKNE